MWDVNCGFVEEVELDEAISINDQLERKFKTLSERHGKRHGKRN